MQRIAVRLVAVVLIALAVALGVQRWELRHAERARQDAEFDAGLAATRVLSARFAALGELRVARLTGEILSVGDCTSGHLFTDRQRTIAPYSVGYSVDLARLDRSSLHWRAADRAMTVDLPDVVAEPPAIDLAQARSRQSGAFISRRCGLAMQGQVAGRLVASARVRAARPDYIAAARASARTRVGQLVRTTLAAAGVRDASVTVRFPDERGRTSEHWDTSRSPAEVLGNAD